jgi:glycosyltransferase involved in cell wall biosynthesis
MIAAKNDTTKSDLLVAGARCNPMIAAVVITVFNQARFLAEAITSVLTQTRPADEIIVVDDGSTDDPASVVAQFPSVRLIRQDNRGPSAARNVGLRSCNASYIVFLDADDRLRPTAIETGLACIARRPDCAFVYGGYRLISENGDAVGPDRFMVIEDNAHLAFLRGRTITTPATLLFRRDCLLQVNGFDETRAIEPCEDFDLYLRITQKYPIASHPDVVAEYRKHGRNASGDLKRWYIAKYAVLDRHKARIASDATALAVFEKRWKNRRGEYARRLIGEATEDWNVRQNSGMALLNLVKAARLAPFLTTLSLLRILGRHAINRVGKFAGV